MDDICDTRDTLGVGVGKWLRDWRVHPYFARCSSHCAGTGPLSEAMSNAANDLPHNWFYQRFRDETNVE